MSTPAQGNPTDLQAVADEFDQVRASAEALQPYMTALARRFAAAQTALEHRSGHLSALPEEDQWQQALEASHFLDAGDALRVLVGPIDNALDGRLAVTP